MSVFDRAGQLAGRFEGVVSGPVEFRGEATLLVNESDQIAEVCAVAKQQLGFDYLLDISSVDHYGEEPRFELVYELYGLEHRCHLRLKIRVGDNAAEVPSVTGVWRGADWHEREIYDMMGVRFRGHPDLRRILMWEGYPYHPLRKDFPLAGKPTELPEVAFTQVSPMAGGPYVTRPGGSSAGEREPRMRGAAATEPEGGRGAG